MESVQKHFPCIDRFMNISFISHTRNDTKFHGNRVQQSLKVDVRSFNEMLMSLSLLKLSFVCELFIMKHLPISQIWMCSIIINASVIVKPQGGGGGGGIPTYF